MIRKGWRKLVKVKFLPLDKVVQVPAGSNILQAAIAAGVQVESTCGGKGTCGKCKVQIQAENFTPASSVEKKFLSAAQLGAGWVLACQRTISEDMVVRVREQKDVNDRKIGFTGMAKIDAAAPSVCKYPLVVPQPRAADQTPDWERLLAALLCKGIRFSLPVAASLPKTLRRGNFQMTAVLDNDVLLAVEPGDTLDRCLVWQ